MNEHDKVWMSTAEDTNENPFSCSSSDKKFSEHANMNEHDRGHSNQIPFSCSSRDKKFSEHLNMNEHSRGHSEIKTLSAAPHVTWQDIFWTFSKYEWAYQSTIRWKPVQLLLLWQEIFKTVQSIRSMRKVAASVPGIENWISATSKLILSTKTIGI